MSFNHKVDVLIHITPAEVKAALELTGHHINIKKATDILLDIRSNMEDDMDKVFDDYMDNEACDLSFQNEQESKDAEVQYGDL